MLKTMPSKVHWIGFTEYSNNYSSLSANLNDKIFALATTILHKSPDNKIYSTFKFITSGATYKAVSKIQSKWKYMTSERAIARNCFHSRYLKVREKNSYQNPARLTYWVTNLVRAFGKVCRHPMWTYREETWK